MKSLNLILISLFLCSVNIISQNFITGRVIKVTDGDTFTILTDQKEQIRVRFYGIDAPERKQDFGTKARNFVNDLVYNKKVKIENKGIDRYKRVLGVVWVGNTILNEELLKKGLAWHYTHFDKSKRYADLEKYARYKKINIWSMKNPIAPWEYRKQK